MSDKHLDKAEVLNLVYTGQANAMADNYARLMDDLSQMTAWGRGLEHDKRLLQEENARLKAECQARQAENSVLAVECDSLKAEVDRLTSDLQMEKENEDRLVREWQKANNEVYGLKTQVAALIDDQARLKAEVERLTTENSLSTPRHLIASQDIKTLREQVKRMAADLDELEGIRSYLKWNGLQADLKDWLDWRSGRNGSEIPFPKDYLPPKP
jgi:chromosome segregation ATPase